MPIWFISTQIGKFRILDVIVVLLLFVIVIHRAEPQCLFHKNCVMNCTIHLVNNIIFPIYGQNMGALIKDLKFADKIVL